MADLSRDDARAFLDEMWLKFAHLAHERVAALEAYVEAVRAGSPTESLRAAAESAAHKLVGALGSYQRPGSEEAARAEQLLREDSTSADLGPLVRRLRELVS